MSKKALITGVTGQDGAYLSKLLLEKGYKVYGLLARRSSDTQWRLRHLGIENEVDLMEGDLTDLSSLTRLLAAIDADEVYNLGAQSFVATSWMQPVLTGMTTGIGAVNLLGSNPAHRSCDSFLSGLKQRDVWQDTGARPVGTYAFLSSKPLWRGQTIRALDDRQLSGKF